MQQATEVLAALAGRISGITADSRLVKPGYLFAAIPGVTQNGEAYILSALEQGAIAVLTRPECSVEIPEGVPHVRVENPRQCLAHLAAAYYAPAPRHLFAITGTDGKTSTAEFCRQLCESSGERAATLGTLGVRSDWYQEGEAFPNTTPDPVLLHRLLQALVARGVECAAIEASSHGLDQYRLDGITPEAAAFTTFGHDHGDYHPTPEAYFAAKARLFAELLPAGGRAVLNADDARIMTLHTLCAARGHGVVTFGAQGEEFRLVHTRPVAAGLEVSLRILGQEWRGTVPLYGAFQMMNVLAAAALVWPLLEGAEHVFSRLPALRGVPGRLEQVAKLPGGMPIFVDYAHTEQALGKVLDALRPHAHGRLWVVFGCGGDRDRAKRPAMGRVAAQKAECVIVTDDNPRSEDSAAIRREILAACPEAREIGDRRAAIAEAVRGLERGDVLVVAGKGHETTQVIGTIAEHFSDAEVIRAEVAGL
jgi:UDP-N-acetylmuramoyl-L-alanyl-D-glutamate--2,6-diaminopimelate ligase